MRAALGRDDNRRYDYFLTGRPPRTFQVQRSPPALTLARIRSDPNSSRFGPPQLGVISTFMPQYRVESTSELPNGIDLIGTGHLVELAMPTGPLQNASEHDKIETPSSTVHVAA